MVKDSKKNAGDMWKRGYIGGKCERRLVLGEFKRANQKGVW